MNNNDVVRTLSLGKKTIRYFDITRLESLGFASVDRLPFSIRILVENVLRKLDNDIVTQTDLENIVNWQQRYDEPVEIPYHPARVLMQDFTGVPAVVDLAAMRDAVKDFGGDPQKINPVVPVDLVADHSVQVDYFGSKDALTKNVAMEYERNAERYKLLKWAQRSFDNFRVVPPNSGICHQVNLEHIGSVIFLDETGDSPLAYPDTLVGTDSHTTMINGIGVMGWGVGGIEAEAVMLGQPYYMSIPEVVGVKMSGALKPGVTATDLVLTVTEMLRQYKVVEKFVEFFGPGMKQLSAPDRATIANMSPEYGATMGFFPIDEKTIDYLRLTGRSECADLVEQYARETGLFYDGIADPEYTDVLEIDLGEVAPSVAGPARPQDRIPLSAVPGQISDTSSPREPVSFEMDGQSLQLTDNSVVIAAITSCTNTSNPFVMIGAGMMAQKAVERGLRVPPYVKTSLAPGSRVVEDYLNNSGMMESLEQLGFHLAGFGCTTCIGNSGPLPAAIEKVITDNDLNVAAVLSGNRNFEARIHQKIRGNYLMSPMLVVAFALAGRVDVDLTTEPLGTDSAGKPVYLADIWPDMDMIRESVNQHVTTSLFETQYARIFDGDQFWRDLPDIKSLTFEWDDASTYIRRPPYFEGMRREPTPPTDIENARILMTLGDSVTTDHISPAGAIPEHYPAGRYLVGKGVDKTAFNSYGSRRGNHEVMMRGTFGNIRIKNLMVSPKEGSYALKQPENAEMFVYDAAMGYAQSSVPLIVLGGREYGTGSSRDWAAKGTQLLGVRAVIATSFERIHRSNLVGMGVLPLMFLDGENWQSLGLDGTEIFSIKGITPMEPRKILSVSALKTGGGQVDFKVIARLDTAIEVTYFRNGGILQYVLRKMM